jgi:hypothetical protein
MSRSRSLARSGLLGVTASILLAGGAVAPEASAVTLGQVDDFEDGTTQGWVINLLGSSTPAGAVPTNVSTGGPGGAGDHYLRLSSIGGRGAGSRLVGINLTQWACNFLTQNVLGISASVINLGATDLSLRLYVEDSGSGSEMNTAISTQAISLPSGSGWTHVVFPTTADALTALTGSASTALSNVTELRILHSLTAAFPGEVIVAQLGIDNFTAVPEPGTGLLAGLGLVALAARGRP